MTDARLITYLSDRPVGIDGDLLWEDDIIHEEIEHIAETIVSALGVQGEGSKPADSMTFAVYGKWGMGKSSALRMIREKCIQLTEKANVSDRLVFCDYIAPAYEVLEYDVRVTMAMQMFAAVSGDLQGAIDDLFPDIPTMEKLQSVQSPVDTTGGRSHRFQEIVAVLTRLVDFDKLLTEKLQGTAEGKDSKVLVVLIDDLDRCQTGFVWKVLNTIQQLSGVPNLFFVIAVDQNRLRKTVEEQSERVEGAISADFALEKYVQHAIQVPDIDGERLDRFLQNLFQPDNTEEIAQAFVENVVLIRYGLQVQTPRSIKRCINTIRTDLRHILMQMKTPDDITRAFKERILKYVWPDFYEEYFRPAKRQKETDQLSGIHFRSFYALERACKNYVSDRDEEQLRFELNRIARARPYKDIESIPMGLVRYLGIEPYWFVLFVPGEDKKSGVYYDALAGYIPQQEPQQEPPAVEEEFTLSDVSDIEDKFTELYFQSEAAEKQGNKPETHRLVREFYDLVTTHQFTRKHAPTVGNVAITAENLGDRKLAQALYERALKLDPDHANNMQNYVDFIVKAPVPELFDTARDLLQRLAQEFPSHKPERTQLLDLQLQRMGRSGVQGSEMGIDPQTVKGMIEEFAENPTHKIKFVSMMNFMSQVAMPDAAEELAKLYYHATTHATEKALALRIFADISANASDDQNENRAAEIYRYLLEDSVMSDVTRSDRADILHNYATILYKHDYDDEAGKYWFEAYGLKPMDQTIRRAYGIYLLRAGHPEIASGVGAGQPIEERVLQPKLKEMPDRFMDQEQCWWESPNSGQSLNLSGSME